MKVWFRGEHLTSIRAPEPDKPKHPKQTNCGECVLLHPELKPNSAQCPWSSRNHPRSRNWQCESVCIQIPNSQLHYTANQLCSDGSRIHTITVARRKASINQKPTRLPYRVCPTSIGPDPNRHGSSKARAHANSIESRRWLCCSLRGMRLDTSKGERGERSRKQRHVGREGNGDWCWSDLSLSLSLSLSLLLLLEPIDSYRAGPPYFLLGRHIQQSPFVRFGPWRHAFFQCWCWWEHLRYYERVRCSRVINFNYT